MSIDINSISMSSRWKLILIFSLYIVSGFDEEKESVENRPQDYHCISGWKTRSLKNYIIQSVLLWHLLYKRAFILTPSIMNKVRIEPELPQ